MESESGNFQCEKTSSPLNPNSMSESRCSRLSGQDQGKVQHQQSILQQRGKKRRVTTLQIGKTAVWCESARWRSPESPLSPQFVLCPLETGSDQGGVLHRPCPPGDQAETRGQLVAQKLRQQRSDFRVDFSKVSKCSMRMEPGPSETQCEAKHLSNLIICSVGHFVNCRLSQTHRLLTLTNLKPGNTKFGCCAVIWAHLSAHSYL